MAKEELLEMQGVVVENLPDARYLVLLDNGHSLVAYTAGKMRKHHIRILAGDKVSLEISPYDNEQGPHHLPAHRRPAAGGGPHAAAPLRRPLSAYPSPQGNSATAR